MRGSVRRLPSLRCTTLVACLAIDIAGCLGNAGLPPGTCTVSNVTVAPISTELAVGATTTLMATVVASNCGTLPVTWASSATKVASVDGKGVVTALSSGTAIIVSSTPDTGATGGKSGSAVVTVQGSPTLGVTMSTPDAGATNVGIDSPVRIQFSAAIDSTSVTASTIRVTTPDSAVSGTFVVDSNVVTFTPAQPLTEFNTVYTVTVTTGVHSVVGNFLRAPLIWTFTTVFWDPAFTYRVTNESFGDAKSLDTHAATLECFMGDTGPSISQRWYFVPSSEQIGYSTAHNLLGADTTSLQGNVAPARCALVAPQQGAAAAGQLWKPVPFGAPFPNGYRLQNVQFGAEQSLDAPIVNGEGAPMMQATSSATSQVWHFARSARR